MNNLGIIVQARTSSARLPNKVVLPFYRNKSIIEIIIEKLKKLDLKIYVATSKKKSDDIIEKICNKVRVTCYRGDEHNVLSRFILISEQNNLSHAVRVCCDNPFINIELLNAYGEVGSSFYVTINSPLDNNNQQTSDFSFQNKAGYEIFYIDQNEYNDISFEADIRDVEVFNNVLKFKK